MEVQEKVQIILSAKEHIDYKWYKKEDLDCLPLIEDLEECMGIILK
jgi:hypothetical protein